MLRMLKTAGITFGSKLGSALINFGIIIALSQLLGPAERGRCALYLLLLSMVAGLSDVLSGSATSFLIRTFRPNEIYRMHAVWAVVPSVLIPSIWGLSGGISMLEMVMLVIAGWFHSRYNLQQHLLLALHQFRRFNFNGILFPLTSALFFLFLWKSGIRSGLGYLFSIGITWFLLFFSNNILFKQLLLPNPMTSETKPGFPDLMKPGFLNQLGHLISILNSRLIFFLLPAATLGAWSNVLTITEGIFLIPGSLGQILYAFLSKMGSGNKSTLLREAFVANIFVSALAACFLFFIPESLWLLLFGYSFHGFRDLLLPLIPGMFFYTLYLIISYIQSSKGRFGLNLLPLLAGLSLNVIVTIWHMGQESYTLQIGISALAAGWILSALVALGILIWQSRIISGVSV